MTAKNTMFIIPQRLAATCRGVSERREPGTALREAPQQEQNVVIAGLLRQLWRKPAAPQPRSIRFNMGPRAAGPPMTGRG